MSLKTDYVDDVLNTSVNTQRKYNMTTNSDGTVSLTDTTTYTQEGDNYGAAAINATNVQVNENTDALGGLIFRYCDVSDLPSTLTTGTITFCYDLSKE